jgi:L-asparagine transporter-like permease
MKSAVIAVTEHLVHNEQVKLTATLLNGVAVVAIAAAFVQNFFVAATDPSKFGGNPSVLMVFLFAGLFLHMVARQILRVLSEKEPVT